MKVCSVKMARFVQCQPVTPLKFYRMRFTRLPPFPLGFFVTFQGKLAGEQLLEVTTPHLSAQF